MRSRASATVFMANGRLPRRPLQERVTEKQTWRRVANLVILFLLLSLLSYRLSSLPIRRSTIWFLALFSELCFTFLWFLYLNVSWTPAFYATHPDSLSTELGKDELPAVDVFVTTADPMLEPPLITVNTVLSLLAVEYPADRLACYVSDDGGSPVTCFALVEAAKFAEMWVPFCKRYNVQVRAPFMYFSSEPESSELIFQREWKEMKMKYAEMKERIENAMQNNLSLVEGEDFIEFLNIERGNHASIVKVIQQNKMGEDGVPHLVYVSREKRPKHGHHFKAGAMNVLSRVSGVMTNAPYMLNVDCDMFANNPKVILHGMCLLLGFEDESSSGYAQAPQRFYGGLKDDPFGNQLVVINRVMIEGFSGIQGPLYEGTGCFHRRKAIYGSPPPNLACNDGLSYKELKRRFGNSRELIESPKEVMADEFKGRQPWACEISSAIDISKQVASCTFEHKTCWGREVGWVYGSMVEDVMTGIRIQAMGWKSVYFKPEPSAFVGCAPTDGPGSLVQYKRWATGLLEVLLDRDYSPIAAARTKRLRCRQALAYLTFNVWALRCIPELIYSLLPAYCLITGNTIWPRASEREFLLPAAVFVGYNLHSMNEYLWCGLSLRAWWNNQRMQRITVVTSFLLGLLSVVVKLLGISDTVFEITRKEQRHEAGPNAKEDEPGRFTFDDSPIFVSGTALVLVQLAALAAAAIRLGAGSGGGGLGEAVCCGWVVASFWPFVRGFFGRGRYGIPWSVMLKAGLLAFVFVVICPTALLKHLH